MNSAAGSTQSQKPAIKSRDEAACVMLDGVLSSVFSYAGPGQWLFITPVCKKWLAVYEKMLLELQTVRRGPANPATAAAALAAERPDRVTLFSAALESLSCMQYAVANGLQVDGLNRAGVYAFARACGRHGSREVILWARQAGMPWNA
jgi:hypothetical protein